MRNRLANRRDAARHIFSIGQAVRLKRWCGSSHRFEEIYQITGTLPPRDNSPQYRIRNDEEGHDRVATQDSLEPVSQEQPVEGTTLIERTFGHVQETKHSSREIRKPKQVKAPSKSNNAFGAQIKLAETNAPRGKGKN